MGADNKEIVLRLQTGRRADVKTLGDIMMKCVSRRRWVSHDEVLVKNDWQEDNQNHKP